MIIYIIFCSHLDRINLERPVQRRGYVFRNFGLDKMRLIFENAPK